MGDDLPLVFRPSGDDYLLMELGPQALDLEVRFRIHTIYLKLLEAALPGILELTPGIRSLQVHYDPGIWRRRALIETLEDMARSLAGQEPAPVPSRIVHLPLSWDDPACHEAIHRYTTSVRPGAPWCPSNIEFIRRINGLASAGEVRDIVFDADYLVMGLGDVYLGAPVATPVDPAHRLVTTKYNPARTWTAENSVGIGGAYLCIYGMEGPGGYQFVGRTLQMWNRYTQTDVFTKPWLLRFFDQVRFYPVSHEELAQLREAFVRGRFRPDIEETTFSLADYRALLERRRSSIDDFRAQRQVAFDAEMRAWREAGEFDVEDTGESHDSVEATDIPAGHFVVESHVSGNVWKCPAEPGAIVDDDDPLLVLESMKMELMVTAGRPGRLVEYLVSPGQQVGAGQTLALLAEV